MATPYLFMLLVLLAAISTQLPTASLGQVAADDSRYLTFEPRKLLDEQLVDQQTAATYFAHAQLLQLQGEPARALRRYQRAWRYDSEATSILQQIVPLAQSLGRSREATRYAILAAERSLDDPNLLTQLALYLVEQKDTRRAVSLFEKALELRRAEEPDSTRVSLQIELGRFYLSFEEYDKAANLFREVRAAIDPTEKHGLTEKQLQRLLKQQIDLYEVMGESLLALKQFENAREMFRRAHASKPNRATLSFGLARIAFGLKRFTTAREHLDLYLAEHASSAGTAPYKLLREILREELNNDVAKAEDLWIERLRETHAEDKHNAPLGYSLADCLFKSKDVDSARQLYLELLDTAATTTAYQRLVEIADRQLDDELLLQVAGKAIAATDAIGLLSRNDNEPFAQEEVMAAAIERAQNTINVEVDETAQREAIAASLLAVRLNDHDSVRKLLAKALRGVQISPSSVREVVGLELFTHDHYAEAVEVFQAAIDDENVEKKPRFYYYLSGALELAGETERALHAAEKAAEMRDELPSFRIRPAWVQYHAKRYVAAELRYQKLLRTYDVDHSSAESRQAVRDIRYVLANIYSTLHRYEAAVELLEQILDEFPEDSDALNDLGYLWAERGKHLNRALRMVQAAVASDPDSAAYRDSLGWTYFKLGRIEDAIRELEKATRDSPDGVILEHLGEAYEKAERPADAISTWKRAVKAYDQAKEFEASRKVTLKIKGPSVK